MSLAPGTRLGPYEILTVIGAGGMGEVYRARDAKLGRDVAIKILPQAFQDADRIARFEREARVLASLTHPHIGAIFGFEQAGDLHGLVLELVDGQTLAERLSTGPIPLVEALTIARQIADALDAAHEQGIVHRDLKPANVKITTNGTVKVLDFGLAKVEDDEPAADVTHSPTVAVAGTRHGVILGTAGYMSPEQARGKSLDKRTDIWSFGCVFFEMLTGRQAFPGETVSDAIAAILSREPDWALLDRQTPPEIRRLLQRCFEKDARQRLRDIGDVRHEIDHVLSELRADGSSAGRSVSRASRSFGSSWMPIAASAVALALVAVAAVVFFRRPEPSAVVQQAAVQLTDFTDSVVMPALSPDGRMLTFIRGGNFGDSAPRGHIYVKLLPKGEPVQLTRDQSGKEQPVFAPDGSRIVYTSVMPGFKWDTWQVPVLGGAPQPFLPNASGLVWMDERQMLYAEIMSGVHMGIVTSTESRNESRAVYFPKGEGSMAHRSMPSPDGKSLLVAEMDGSGWLPCRLMPFDGSGIGRPIGPPDGQCTTLTWSPDGRWMYFSSNAGGGHHIWRQRYPDGVPEQVTSGPTEQEGIAMSPDGKFMITSMGISHANIWFQDTAGERQLTSEGFAMLPSTGLSGEKVYYLLRTANARAYASGELWSIDLKTAEKRAALPSVVMSHYSISADERRVVFTSSGSSGGDGVWIADLDRRTPPRQLTRDGAFRVSFGAPGEIVYMNQGETRYLYRMKEDGTGVDKIVPEPVIYLISVSRDGEWAAAAVPRTSSGGGTVVRLISLRGGTSMDVCNAECGIGFGPNRIQAPMFNWSVDGKSMYVGLQYFGLRTRPAETVILPYRSGVPLATLWPKGLKSEKDVAANPGAVILNDGNAFPAAAPSSRFSWRRSTQSNLYRIALQN